MLDLFRLAFVGYGDGFGVPKSLRREHVLVPLQPLALEFVVTLIFLDCTKSANKNRIHVLNTNIVIQIG